MCDWETIGELTLSNFEKKKKKNNNKNTSRESKNIHCAMKPIRIQLECPYNSSNKKTHVWVFTFLYSLHKQCTFLYISTCARGHEHKCAISFIQQCIATGVWFREWISFWTNRVSQWFNGPFRWSHLFSFYWISRFERIVWFEWFSKSFIKTETSCHLLAVLYHIYLSMTDLNQPRCQHKNTFSKILFNYQYLPKFLYFRPQKENKQPYK